MAHDPAGIPHKRRFDNYKAVEWAIAAKELGFPLQTDSKRIVREWRSTKTKLHSETSR